MKKSRMPDDRVVTAFKEACVRRNLRTTHQRLEIFRELSATGEHPDAITIYRRVRKRIPTISLDTVYRNLKLLAEYGLISIVGMSDERLRFDANMTRHHHFSCVRCGMIRDFYSVRLNALKMPEEAKAFGDTVSLHVEVKGVCDTCIAGKRGAVSRQGLRNTKGEAK